MVQNRNVVVHITALKQVLYRSSFLMFLPTLPQSASTSRNHPSQAFSLTQPPYCMGIDVTCYLSSSCHVAHKASTQSPQPSLSAAAICTSLQFFHPAFSISLPAVFLHNVLGLPRFRRPSGAQVNAVLQSLFGSFLMMWPMNGYGHRSKN